MRVYRKDEARLHLSRVAGEPVTLRPQYQGAGFLHPGPQTAAEDEPGGEKPPRLDGREQIAVPLPNLKFQQPPWKNFIAFFTPKVAALYQTPWLQPQSFSDCTDSTTHWSIISFRQQSISTLSAHPNYNCTVRRVKLFKKKNQQVGRASAWALQDCRVATTNAL